VTTNSAIIIISSRKELTDTEKMLRDRPPELIGHGYIQMNTDKAEIWKKICVPHSPP
jgi:hypothetical protein